MDASSLQSLLNGSSGTTAPATSLFNLDAILKPLMPFMIILTVVSVIITVLYLVSIIQKWRANAAIIEMRDILREMNTARKQDAPALPSAPTPTTPEVAPQPVATES